MDQYNREWRRNRVLVMQLTISSDSEESEEEQSAANGGSETQSSCHLVEEKDGGDVSCHDSPDSHSDFATSDDAFTSSDSDCDYISSEDNIEDSSIDVVYQVTERSLENNLKMKLRNWATKTHQTRESINEMLSIFRDEGYKLPKDARTLLRTPRSISTVSLCCGSYSYFFPLSFQHECIQAVEGVAPGTGSREGQSFGRKAQMQSLLILTEKNPNEKTWQSFKLVKVKFTSDKEEDCHEYDATTAEEGDDQDNRRGVKRKKEEDFLYEMDEADGALEQVLDDMSNDQAKDKGDRKLNKVLRRLSSSKKKQREQPSEAHLYMYS
ncbi:hypothetical protein CAPTEDRAFT_200123 [Capitella teleta]|uniref:Uncharacterized protein n=1 Tax=Capitella teleta TaxID=283909 RepID=R7V9N7_CAPTE|nr:hypothetical protein CAPTEDRAFT_200123 [Capitella teleta]|eukprot:ELU13066.1 hypothetical protein CAPTEDRAFT_200123 [Capitella teleta]